ncbi:hypothetical protein RRG08_052399 [Elysia crispata]|uniref:Uncharacterized protein n=1 Tax=Elysia crispata TaxID=231223 RepID=A0AAE1B0Y7_9GAST|nr:hypothetical protein RRG08_052399 [Elysia crispata]
MSSTLNIELVYETDETSYEGRKTSSVLPLYSLLSLLMRLSIRLVRNSVSFSFFFFTYALNAILKDIAFTSVSYDIDIEYSGFGTLSAALYRPFSDSLRAFTVFNPRLTGIYRTDSVGSACLVTHLQ